MSRQAIVELDFHPAVLAAMCRHAWDEEGTMNCTVGPGLKCPFNFQICCTEVKASDWEAVCLAKEEKDEV